MTTDFHDPIPEEAPGYSFIPNRRFAQIAKAIGETGSRIDEKGNLVLDDGDFSRNHVVFGKAHLWVDGNGNPRWNGGTPANNEDGVILRGKDAPPPDPDAGGDIVAPVNPNPTVFVNLAGPINTVSALLSLDETRLLVGTGSDARGTTFSYVYTIDDPFAEANFAQSLTERFAYRLVGLGGGVALASTGYLGRIYRSADRGATWNFVGEVKAAGRGLYPETRGLIHRGAGIVLAGSRNTGQIWRTNNGGDSWADTGFAQSGVRNVWDFTAGTGGRVHAACGGTRAAIFYTDDLGAIWQAPTTQPTVGTDISAIAAFPSGRLVAGTAGSGRPTVFLSDDGGVTWFSTGQLPAQSSGRDGVRTTWLLPLGGTRMLLSTGRPGSSSGGHIYETTDGGDTWIYRVSPGPNTNFIGQMVRHQGKVYAGLSGGSRRVYQIIP